MIGFLFVKLKLTRSQQARAAMSEFYEVKKVRSEYPVFETLAFSELCKSLRYTEEDIQSTSG